MNALAEFVMTQGGWGAWILTVAWIVWMVSTGKFVTKDRLDAERKDKEFWREAATLSSELGSMLAKAKVSLSRGDNDN